MFDQIDVMRMAREAAVHAAARQSVIARNLANADTPGFRAADLQPFAQAYDATRSAFDLKVTRAGHIASAQAGSDARVIADAGLEAAPNGNTVSLEFELQRASSAKRQHDVSLAVYKTSLDILRTALGRGR